MSPPRRLPAAPAKRNPLREIENRLRNFLEMLPASVKKPARFAEIRLSPSFFSPTSAKVAILPVLTLRQFS